MISAYTFDDLFYRVCQKVNDNPRFMCSPRGKKIKEEIAFTICLHNPRARILSSPSRNANYGFAVGEFLWYYQGRKDLEMMQYYNKRMKSFSDDGETLNSAYGNLIHYGWDRSEVNNWPSSQWDMAIKTLTSDPDSRRCILQIHQPWHQELAARPESTKDVPCTLSLQFFIRNEALYLHTNMRSNDIFWGLSYDLFSFTLFQECMLLELKADEKFKNLKLGEYFHTAGSMHIYEQHFEQTELILKENRDYQLLDTEPMREISSLRDLSMLIADENLLRKKHIHMIDLNKYSGALKWMAHQLNDHRTKRDLESL